ncbi:MAG TPA: peptidase M28, partial [Duganella sp.]|nr:peptidase M28 [Duganella sp.]
MKSVFPFKLSLTILAGCMLSAGAIGAPTPANDPATLARIRDSAMNEDWAYARLADLTDLVGPRL